MAKLSFAMKLAETGMPFIGIMKILMKVKPENKEMGLFWATEVVPRIPKKMEKIWG